jgi:hypothetical protein
MSYQLTTAKIWNGTAWVDAAGGSKPWWQTYAQKSISTTVAGSVIVTASASINTKGAWTQLIASTAGNGDCLAFNLAIGSNGVDSASLVDIGIGAAGAETAIISNVAVGGHSVYPLVIPVKVPSGSRISMRTQSVISSRGATVHCVVLDTGSYADVPTSVTTIGTNTATSLGTQTTNNAFVELTSSTAAAYKAIIVVPSLSSGTVITTATLFELATGAAGSETVVGSIPFISLSSETITAVQWSNALVAGAFPAGTRLSVRTNAGGGGVADVCLIGIP